MEKFSKNQFLDSEKFKKYYDVVSVVLEDNKLYTISETEKKINDFIKKEVI